MEIKNPGLLEMVLNGKVVYGLNQEWYHTPIKKKAGCGPAAAATLLLYMNKRENGPLGYNNSNLENAVEMLDDVWRFVRPGLRGLHRAEKFAEGVRDLCGNYGLDWECRYIKVDKGASLTDVAGFIEKGLTSDCPVAFLNLHRGNATAFDSWHWIVLTGLREENGRFIATGLDEGRIIEFDLAGWVKSTKMGGGFAYISKKTQQLPVYT